MPANIYREGSFRDLTPESDDESTDNVGLVEWRITIECHSSGGSQWVDDPRCMNKHDDPWCDFSLYYRVREYNGSDKWRIGYDAGMYKTKRGYWETHVGYPYANTHVEGKGLCTILYRNMLEYALNNGIKVTSSEAYSYNSDVKKLYNRLEKYFNFKSRGRRVFLKNKKKNVKTK